MCCNAGISAGSPKRPEKKKKTSEIPSKILSPILWHGSNVISTKSSARPRSGFYLRNLSGFTPWKRSWWKWPFSKTTTHSMFSTWGDVRENLNGKYKRGEVSAHYNLGGCDVRKIWYMYYLTDEKCSIFTMGKCACIVATNTMQCASNTQRTAAAAANTSSTVN